MNKNTVLNELTPAAQENISGGWSHLSNCGCCSFGQNGQAGQNGRNGQNGQAGQAGQAGRNGQAGRSVIGIGISIGHLGSLFGSVFGGGSKSTGATRPKSPSYSRSRSCR